MIFCTVSSNKHLIIAKVMARSIKRVHPHAKVVMCLIERNFVHFNQVFNHTDKILFDNIVLARDLGFHNFNQMIFKYSNYEGPGSCKAKLLLHALNIFPEENKVVYIDSDIKAFGPFIELEHLLDCHPIIITPHILSPSPNNPYPIRRPIPQEIEYIQCANGVYNSGFLAVSRTTQAIQFLSWWANRLEHLSYVDRSRGVFGDQRFLDLTPSIFNSYILKHPGYNASWWNHLERNITLSHGQYRINGQPLRCFHFSGILVHKERYLVLLKARFPNPRDPIHQLIREYISEVVQAGQNFNKQVPWSYDFFHNGEVVSPATRQKYRHEMRKYNHIPDPFHLSNKAILGN